MMADGNDPAGEDSASAPGTQGGVVSGVRMFGWFMLAALVVFLINNYLTNWLGWPGPLAALNGGGALAIAQLMGFPAACVIAAVFVVKSGRGLRDDSEAISNINVVLIRMAFYMVLFVGLADAVISFLRVEGLLPTVVGQRLATELSISSFRGTYVHIPLIVLAVVVGWFGRTLGFHWLTLMAVGAELLIVITRFVFSYEQAFMADLVRFWYAALFLFASAHTLLEEGHVRVDVLYAAFARKTRGRVNSLGSVLLGVSLCWVILSIGMFDQASIINSALLAFETTQTGFGMYVKYLMAGFLGIFAISMMIQFISYMMDAVADWRGEPGGRDHDVHAVQ